MLVGPWFPDTRDAGVDRPVSGLQERAVVLGCCYGDQRIRTLRADVLGVR
jgi:hypothetical protein